MNYTHNRTMMLEERKPSHPVLWLLGVLFVAAAAVACDDRRPKDPRTWLQYLACFGAGCWAVVLLHSISF